VKPKNFKYIIGYIDNVAAKNKSSLLIEHKTLVEYIPHSLYGPSIIRRDTRTTRTMKLLYPKLSTTYIFEYFIMGELICQTYNFLENKQKNKQAHQLFKKQMIKYKLFGGKT